MRVIVPFTKIVPEVVAALDATGREYEMVRMTDDEAYWRLVQRMWQPAEDWALVEHDIIVHPTAFDEFDACEMAWCSFPHRYHAAGRSMDLQGMGCVRFRTKVMMDAPDALYEVAQHSDINHPPRHWCSLDHYLQAEVLPRHAPRHCHETVLDHMNEGVSHGCI